MGDIIIQAAIFALLSSLYIASGLRILTAKRPFILSQWRQVIFGFATSMAIYIYILWPKYPWMSLLPCILLAIGGMTIVWGIILSRGYMVVGASKIVVSDALGHALRKMNLPYEESAQAYRLPTLNNELLVETTAIDWLFNFRLKRSGDRSTLRQLAAEIDESFRNAPARINRRFSYALVVIGAVILLFGSWLIYERLSLEAKMRSVYARNSSEFFQVVRK
jgi:hypothetical protein